VRRVNRADDCRVEVRVREREAENELQGSCRRAGHRDPPGASVPIAIQPASLRLVLRCGTTANDDAGAILSSGGDRRFVFTLDRRVRDRKTSKTPMAMWSIRWGNVPGHADKPHLAGLFELQECLEAERDSSRSSGLPEERLVGTTIG
jgi:hypothetical protein